MESDYTRTYTVCHIVLVVCVVCEGVCARIIIRGGGLNTRDVDHQHQGKKAPSQPMLNVQCKGGAAGETVCAVSLASSVSGGGNQHQSRKAWAESQKGSEKCKKIHWRRQRQDLSLDAATKVRREPLRVGCVSRQRGRGRSQRCVKGYTRSVGETFSLADWR